jgi:lysophospholipase L1-like esterase
MALVALALCGIVVVVAIAEGLVRVRQWAKYGMATSYESLYRVDPAIPLRVLVPGAKVGNITINSSGFRGPPIETPKPLNRIRIAYLGASTTFCAEVSGDAAVWPNLVTERLASRFPGVRFDFVNAGVPGYVAHSSLLGFEHRVAALDPDVVVIYHATNDLSGEVNALAAAQGLTARDANGPGWMERHLLLWELVAKNLKVRTAQQGAETAANRVVLDKAAFGREYEHDLRELVAATQQKGRLVAVVTFSTQLRAEQSAEERKRAAVSALVYMPSVGLDDLLFAYRRYNEINAKVAREKGALLIAGENDIPGDAVHFVDTVHFSDAGSRRMADRVFEGLVASPEFMHLIAAHKAS